MEDRLYENLRLWQPAASSCAGSFQTPKLAPVRDLPDVARWNPVSELRARDLRETDGVQMYVYDHRLSPLWTRPAAYLPLLSRAGCVLSPDFSLYSDVPLALNVYNHYRKHWLGAWWQMHGLTVIPSICWADEASFAWCFDGEPEGGVVSVSSVGVLRRADTRDAFLRGYDAMLERLRPTVVLFFGAVPEGCRGEIVRVEAFYETIKQRCVAKRDGMV